MLEKEQVIRYVPWSMLKPCFIKSHELEQSRKKMMTWSANLTSIKEAGVGSHTFENTVFEMEFGEPRWKNLASTWGQSREYMWVSHVSIPKCTFSSSHGVGSPFYLHGVPIRRRPEWTPWTSYVFLSHNCTKSSRQWKAHAQSLADCVWSTKEEREWEPLNHVRQLPYCSHLSANASTKLVC